MTGVDPNGALLKEVRLLRQELQKKDEQWVKVTVILLMTGWDRYQLRRARDRGEINYKKNKTGIWYDANSLAPIHILPKMKRA